MNYPQKDKGSNCIYIKKDTFGINKVYELYALVDYINGLSAKDSQERINSILAEKQTPLEEYVSVYKIHNFRRSLYRRLRDIQLPGKLNFQEYCLQKGLSIEKLDTKNYNNNKSYYFRNYLVEEFAINCELKVIEK